MSMPAHLRTRPARAERGAGELCAQDRALLVEALSALLRERLRAMEIIRDVGDERARGALAHEDLGIGSILRLARTLDKQVKI